MTTPLSFASTHQSGRPMSASRRFSANENSRNAWASESDVTGLHFAPEMSFQLVELLVLINHKLIIDSAPR